MAVKTPRDRDLAKIHIAVKQLGIDDDTYRDILWTYGRVRSSADLDNHGRGQVLRYLRKLGFRATSPRHGRKPNTLAREPYLQKIEALLTDMGLSWDYAVAIAWRITGGKGQPGVQHLEWVREDKHWRGIITALTVEQKKRNRAAAIDELLAQLGRDETWLDSILPPALRGGAWRRTIGPQQAIIDTLLWTIDQNQSE